MAQHRRQPRWIPNSVWGAYQLCEEYSTWAESNNAWIESNDVLVPSEQDLKIFEKIVFDKRCEPVWKIIFSRTSGPSLIEVDEKYLMPCQFLLWTLRNALAGPPASSQMPAKERKDRGEVVAKLARKLSKELQYIAAQGDIPTSLGGPLSIHLESVYESHIDRVVDMVELASMEYDEGRQPISLVVRDLFFRGDEGIFGVLARSAEKWAKATPAEYRNDRDKAKRNYFVREMTRYFKTNFSQPHREMVARLAECLLGHQMSALDVTRLAPVSQSGGP